MRSPPRRSPLTRLTPIHRRPGFDISITGMVYSTMMMFMGLAAVNSQAALLFGVFGLMIGILLVSGIVSKQMLRRIEIRRLLPDQATVGRPVLMHYSIFNRKKLWPTLSLTIAEIDGVQGFRRQPHAYLLHVAPQQTAVLMCEVTPKRRGLHVLNKHQLSTSFPFGFIKRAIMNEVSDSLLVFPPIAQVEPRLLQMFRSADTIGHNLRPRPGGTDEFYGLKDYRQGENPRNIYWKRSAHIGELVTKQMTQVSPPRLMVVIDTYNADASFDRRVEVEQSIAQAASLIDVAVDAGLSIGLVCWAGTWVTMSSNRGKRHKREMLSMLAKLPANPDHPPEVLLAQASTSVDSVTTLVLFTGGDLSSTSAGSEGRRAPPFRIGARSEAAASWFRFEKGLDFEEVMPFEESVKGKPAASKRKDAKSASAVTVNS
ncbi:MAG: DUF58 domain-containing protein [Tepidisphaeraceae bacterium]